MCQIRLKINPSYLTWQSDAAIKKKCLLCAKPDRTGLAELDVRQSLDSAEPDVQSVTGFWVNYGKFSH